MHNIGLALFHQTTSRGRWTCTGRDGKCRATFKSGMEKRRIPCHFWWPDLTKLMSQNLAVCTIFATCWWKTSPLSMVTAKSLVLTDHCNGSNNRQLAVQMKGARSPARRHYTIITLLLSSAVGKLQGCTCIMYWFLHNTAVIKYYYWLSWLFLLLLVLRICSHSQYRVSNICVTFRFRCMFPGTRMFISFCDLRRVFSRSVKVMSAMIVGL